MRPVSKGKVPYEYTNGQPYGKAVGGLSARIGKYCSYCERRLNNGIEVEHIQAKDIHDALERVWSNFLVSCKNCNSTKSKKDPALSDWLIPDRDNTAAAFSYRKDGVIEVVVGGVVKSCAEKTLDLMNLNKEVRRVLDEQGNLLALDRRTQRLEAWVAAERWSTRYASNQSADLQDAIIEIVKLSGFFSIWMQAFTGFPDMRRKFIENFPGTEVSCYDAVTTMAVGMHPNSDGWGAGSKL